MGAAPVFLGVPLSHGLDFVGGHYVTRQPPHMSECVPLAPRSSATQRLMEVAAVGFGCVLIHRRVFAAVGAPYFEHPEPGVGEDYLFCKKARDKGFKVYVDAALDVGHIGATTITADYAAAYAQTGAMRAALAATMRKMREPAAPAGTVGTTA